ncbi:MAG: zinc ribbon domain-containing protein [Cyanobacteria bacterium P01_F01_bin.86]
MPLYDYRCDNCGDFEAWRKLAELKIPMVCPSCDETDVKRVFSPPNVHLNSGRFPVGSQSSSEPRLVKKPDREPSQPRNRVSKCNRPWMIGHAAERL